MLRAIGLDRATNVYIANVLKSRPPGNRDPKPEEVAACLPYLQRQIELLQPEDHPGRRAHRRTEPAAHGGAPRTAARPGASLRELNTPLVVTYHPAYLLRTPAEKRKAWEDLKFARTALPATHAGRRDRWQPRLNCSMPRPRRPSARCARADVPEVVAIERASYQFPWSEGIFRDCLRVGYICRVVDARSAGRPAMAS